MPCCCVLLHQVDSDYLKQTRARLAAAAKPAQKRKVAVLEDDLEINQLAGGTKDLPLYVKNRQVGQPAGGRAAGGMKASSFATPLQGRACWALAPS